MERGGGQGASSCCWWLPLDLHPPSPQVGLSEYSEGKSCLEMKDKIKETSSPTETRGEKQLSRLLNINRNEPSLPLLRWLSSLR